MATSEDGADIFEITDFTTASDFERFVARLEEVIHEWKLTSAPPFLFNDKEFNVSSAQWRSISEEVSFINFPFVVTHHYITHKPQQMGDGDADSTQEVVDSRTGVSKSVKDKWPTALRDVYHDSQPFPSKAHCLCRWFGLTSFVIVSPSSYALTDEKRIKTILNAASVALHNSTCQVPMFVQSLESQRLFYLGGFQAPGISTTFEMVHLNKVANRYRNLSGLVEIFKGKVNIPVEPEPKALVSIRTTYLLQDWETFVFDWPQAPPDMEDNVESSSIGWTGVSTLPFGTCQNPIENLHLYAMWCNMSEEVITDNEVYSDIEPMNAPIWTVQVTMSKNIAGLLSESMLKFSELCRSSATFAQVIGSREPKSDESVAELTNALERLTEPQTQYNLPSMSKVSRVVEDSRLRLSGRAQRQSPIPVHVLNKMLLHIFPDAKEEEVKKDEVPPVDTEWVKEAFKCYKTAPVGSIPYRLAVCCCIVNYSFGGLKAVAHLWHEFVLELRYRLDNSVLVPGLESGLPNLSQGLLYQKLQMLNCCIERKIARESGESTQSDLSAFTADADLSAEDADVFTDDEGDEFFDCNTGPSSSVSLEEEVGNKEQPQGRLRKLDNLRLLNENDDLYIPVTQDPAPMTEDTLAEHAEVLTRLGTGEEGATLRAKMQSASLISDMESFKAANIGSVLEDFVRWYSPRDYVVETVIDPDSGETIEKGSLSERMLVADNMWQEAWHNAKAVPAKRQKRLFNDTKEAEKVLHYLSNMKPAAVVLHLLPLALQSAILLIKQQGDELMPSIAPLVTTLTSQLEDCTRLNIQSATQYADVIHYIQTAELVISRARSLHLKFACDDNNKGNKHVEEFVSELMSQQEVKVIGAARGPVGKTLAEMFRESQNKHSWKGPPVLSSQQSKHSNLSPFPPAISKEYLLRLATPRPAPYSQTLPQRMHCILNSSEFRLCGAFSTDNIFK